MADRTFCIERAESPPSQELNAIDNPDEQNTQGCLVVLPGNQYTKRLPRAGASADGEEPVLRRMIRVG